MRKINTASTTPRLVRELQLEFQLNAERSANESLRRKNKTLTDRAELLYDALTEAQEAIHTECQTQCQGACLVARSALKRLRLP